MYVVGLTGGIGSGKSTVARYFSQFGVDVINADVGARQVVAYGQPSLQQIADYFGPNSLLDDGSLNRLYLRTDIFNHPEKRQWLEALLHPLIRDWVKQALAAATSVYCLLESPLLLETNQHQLTHRILVVDVPEQLQIERAMQRDGNTRKQIAAIIQTQISREKRLQLADDIIDNSQHTDTLFVNIKALHARYLRYATAQL